MLSIPATWTTAAPEGWGVRWSGAGPVTCPPGGGTLTEMSKKPPGDVTPPAEPPVEQASQAERTRAYKLRAKLKAGMVLLPSEEDTLREYEARTRARGAPDFGASASERVVHVEERHAAVGSGDAAAHAAAAGAMVREEGKRLDALIAQSVTASNLGITAMQRACELYEAMASNMLADRQQDREEMRTLMASIRTHYLARIDAEGAAAKAGQQEGDPMSQILTMLQELRGMGLVGGSGPRVVPGGKTGNGTGAA